jgi:phosphatidate cytidylyltransferase
MSPRTALESDVFAVYLSLVVGVAVASWILIQLLGRFTGRDVSHAKQSFKGWLLMAPAALVAIFLGRVAAIVFIFGLAMLGFVEYARATGLSRDRALLGVVLAGIAALGIDVALGNQFSASFDWYEIYLAIPLIVTAAIVCVPIVRNRTEGEVRQITLAVFGFVYIGWMFGHLAMLANGRNAYGYLMYLFFAVELNDIAAYVCGRLFGRHKMRRMTEYR